MKFITPDNTMPAQQTPIKQTPIADHRKHQDQGFRWSYDETEDEGGAHVYAKAAGAPGYYVMRLFPEDLTVENFALMAQHKMTRKGKAPIHKRTA